VSLAIGLALRFTHIPPLLIILSW